MRSRRAIAPGIKAIKKVRRRLSWRRYSMRSANNGPITAPRLSNAL